MRERSTTALFLVGILWLIMAVSFGITLYQAYGHIPQMLSYGLGCMLTGLFLGRAIQQWRMNRMAKKEAALMNNSSQL
jgi:hypothetical protein